jgi:hypothetical protein
MTQGDFGHPAIFIIRRGLETEARPEYVEGKSARMPIQSRRRPEGTGRKPVTEGKVLFCKISEYLEEICGGPSADHFARCTKQGDFGHPEIFIIRRGLETQSSSNRRGLVAAIACPRREYLEGKSSWIPISKGYTQEKTQVRADK